MRSLDHWNLPPVLVAENPADVSGIAFHPDGQSLAVVDTSGKVHIWPTGRRTDRPIRILEAKGCTSLVYSSSGRWLAAPCVVDGWQVVRLWDLTALPWVEPLTLRSDFNNFGQLEFEPSEQWLAATSPGVRVEFWPLGEARTPVLNAGAKVRSVAFTPDGAALVSAEVPRAFALGR